MSTYAIKKYRGHMGSDSVAFTCDLHCNGKKVAVVCNGGTGGSHEYQFYSQGDRVSWDAYVKTQDCEFDFEKDDQVIDKMIDAIEVEKQYKRWCKEKVCFRLKGDKADEWRTIKYPWGPQIELDLVQKYGNQIEDILNRRYS